MTDAVRGIENQPVNHVRWIARERLQANDYNPNKVAPPEMQLLKVSILEDGWTQPIVARPPVEDAKPDVLDPEQYDRLTIVDGFHRYTTSSDKQVYEMTGGLVPVVLLPIAHDRAHQIASTIRHNRARGTHYVLRMADLVGELATGLGMSQEDVMRRLGMDTEEYQRLLDRGKMTVRHGQGDFGKGWVPG